MPPECEGNYLLKKIKINTKIVNIPWIQKNYILHTRRARRDLTHSRQHALEKEDIFRKKKKEGSEFREQTPPGTQH